MRSAVIEIVRAMSSFFGFPRGAPQCRGAPRHRNLQSTKSPTMKAGEKSAPVIPACIRQNDTPRHQTAQLRAASFEQLDRTNVGSRTNRECPMSQVMRPTAVRAVLLGLALAGPAICATTVAQ